MQCKLLALLSPVPKHHKGKVLKKPLPLKTNNNMCTRMFLYELCTICVPGALGDQKRVSDSESGGAVCATVLVLGIKPRSSGREASVLNC